MKNLLLVLLLLTTFISCRKDNYVKEALDAYEGKYKISEAIWKEDGKEVKVSLKSNSSEPSDFLSELLSIEDKKLDVTTLYKSNNGNQLALRLFFPAQNVYEKSTTALRFDIELFNYIHIQKDGIQWPHIDKFIDTIEDDNRKTLKEMSDGDISSDKAGEFILTIHKVMIYDFIREDFVTGEVTFHFTRIN